MKALEPQAFFAIMVGVAGFEPAASWTRTKRDTKLRHTPIAYVLYRKFRILSRGRFLCFGQAKSNNTAHSRFRLAVRCYSVLDQVSLRNFPAVLFYLPSFSAFLAALALALASWAFLASARAFSAAVSLVDIAHLAISTRT